MSVLMEANAEEPCFYCGGPLPEWNETGASDYCSERCFERQGAMDRAEYNKKGH